MDTYLICLASPFFEKPYVKVLKYFFYLIFSCAWEQSFFKINGIVDNRNCLKIAWHLTIVYSRNLKTLLETTLWKDFLKTFSVAFKKIVIETY